MYTQLKTVDLYKPREKGLLKFSRGVVSRAPRNGIVIKGLNPFLSGSDTYKREHEGNRKIDNPPFPLFPNPY